MNRLWLIEESKAQYRFSMGYSRHEFLIRRRMASRSVFLCSRIAGPRRLLRCFLVQLLAMAGNRQSTEKNSEQRIQSQGWIQVVPQDSLEKMLIKNLESSTPV